MWTQEEYEGYDGKYWSLPPRKILPKPYVKPHPPMWYAAGNTSSYEMAARKGLGVLGFSVQTLEECDAVIKVYKKAVESAEPVGAFVNDNVMITSAAYVRRTGRRVRAVVDSRMTHLQSNVPHHDTFRTADRAEPPTSSQSTRTLHER
jgi:alkanesulfonate monooxygenase SsuD/methylene tetrahydromethanopterin reductase-like flavin-dependent oxidoreductase (luciferase family)